MRKYHTTKMLAVGLLILAGCGESSSPNKESAIAQAKMDADAKNECFTAVDEQDRAQLQLKTLPNGDVKGSLVIDYAEKGKNDGIVEGKYSGDTLFVDYTFKIGTHNPTVYKNPLAFLKQGDSLVLGVGQIVTTLGKSYFEKGKPVRFDKSKFTFASSECP